MGPQIQDSSILRSPLFIGITAFISVCWLVTLLGWYVTHKKLKRLLASGALPNAAYSDTQSNNLSEQQAYEHLLAVAKQHNLKALDNALQKWLSLLNGDRSQRAMPGDIPESKGIKVPIEQLHRLRFSASQQANNDDSLKQHINLLIDAIKQTRSNWLNNKESKKNTLSDLYPTS